MSQPKKVFKMSNLADDTPNYLTTHSAGTLHALCGAITGLQQLEQQIEKTKYEKEQGIAHTIAVPSDLTTVLVPVEPAFEEKQ